MRALGYVRCSTAEQAVEGMSIAAQESRIASWCEATATDLVAVIKDAGVSGTRPLADRPGGAHIAELLAARNPGVDAVVVVRLDRLGRDAAETLRYLPMFAKGRLGLISVADRIDLGTPQGKAMAQMSAVFAELERELIGQRTADALAALRSHGKAYSRTPFGFDRSGDYLVLHEGEQKTIARMRRMRAKGKSYEAIAKSLNRSGIRAKRGGPWIKTSVKSVLQTAEKVGRPAEKAA